MFIRLRLYKLYFRLILYPVPLIAIVAALELHLPASIEARQTTGFSSYIHLGIFVSLIWSIIIERYRLTSVSKLLQEYSGIIAAVMATAVTYVLGLTAVFISGNLVLSRIVVGLSAFVTALSTVAIRLIFRTVIRSGKKWQTPTRVLLIGTDGFARRAAMRLTRGPFSAFRIVGYVQMPGQDILVRDAPIFSLEELPSIRLGSEVDDIIVAIPPEHLSALSEVMRIAETLCTPVRVVIDLDHVFLQEKVFQLGRLQLVNIAATPMESLRYLLLKRAFDIGFALVAIALTLPLMTVIALIIKLTSPGPVLFVQDRVGLNGKIFNMLKFRSMQVADTEASNVAWTTENDPRRTAFGRLLRKTSLDELPQFFNVFMGDMSVVGPRPERPHFVQKFQHDYAHYNGRHRLKVGITGLAQVHGYRGDTSIRKRVQYDLYYLQNWSLWLDIRIVFLTLFTGLVNRHAY